MSRTAAESTHDQVHLMLPWYVNETVNDADRALIESHIGDCETCAAAISDLQVLKDAVLQESVTPIMPEPNIGRLLDSLDDEGSQPRFRGVQWAAAAVISTLTLGVFAYLLVAWQGGDAPTRFETATSGTGADSIDYVLDIEFAADTLDSERNAILQAIEAAIVSDGTAGDKTRAVVRLPALSLQDLDRFTAELELRPDINSVEVVAVQLPARREQ